MGKKDKQVQECLNQLTFDHDRVTSLDYKLATEICHKYHSGKKITPDDVNRAVTSKAKNVYDMLVRSKRARSGKCPENVKRKIKEEAVKEIIERISEDEEDIDEDEED